MEVKLACAQVLFWFRKACLGNLPAELSNWRRRVQCASEMARLRSFIVYVDSICSSKAPPLHFRYIGIERKEFWRERFARWPKVNCSRWKSASVNVILGVSRVALYRSGRKKGGRRGIQYSCRLILYLALAISGNFEIFFYGSRPNGIFATQDHGSKHVLNFLVARYRYRRDSVGLCVISAS